jgi:CheY-like chemotaxis protein
LKSKVSLLLVHGNKVSIEKVQLEEKKRPIPSSRPHAGKNAQSRDQGVPSALSDDLTLPLRVLAVDDEPDMIKVVTRGLRQKGFEVDGFTDSIQAFEQFKPGQYDLVLLDIRMPGMNGIEFFRRIRALDSDVIICFVSAYEHYKQEFEFAYPEEKTGCFIPKPVRIDNLVSIITDKFEEVRGRVDDDNFKFD